MLNLDEPPPVTEQLTVKKALRVVGIGLYVIAHIINGLCIAVVFIHLGSTVPTLKPYAGYVAFYTLGARSIFFVVVFFVGCYWCILRLVAPKQAGSNISDWSLKMQASMNPSDGKIGRARRIFSVATYSFAAVGALNTYNGSSIVFRSWKAPEFSAYQFVAGLVLLGAAAWLIHIAYAGRLPTNKGENITLGNNDSQPESDEVTPGEYKEDDTTAQ
ncbi:uncharacterized protein EDB91DRAFT_1246754 [Suillus paluster]|uniref:uncharacterized protein n=1 Tax=Suillus paluster TaxID=48578 RepID=UPI001B86D7BB|nr:uncharacterized protein EDB91DRAFT_1246754 [Suillus paluster]KAG1744639.1 hypothetical protein EDB91DRAFT_1246754 [Suillus paluster]